MPYNNQFSRHNRVHTRPQGGNRRPQQGRRFGAYIHPDKFINKAKHVEAEVYVPTHKFSDFALSKELQQNIAAHGYTDPTPIQDQGMQAILDGKDLVGIANTGTGKTAAFLLPMIQNFLDNGGKGQALIIVPTRELATQIYDEFQIFSKRLGIYAVACYGGVRAHNQIRTLARKPHVVIGTPGRLKDLTEQGALVLAPTHFLVLDEADRMVDMGFITDIRFLIEQLPTKRQSLCFSATHTPETDRLIRDFLTDPVSVSVRTQETSDHVEQDIIRAGSKEEKIKILHELLQDKEFYKVLVFGQTKHTVQQLSEKLRFMGHTVEAIHGNKSQPQRQRALEAFKRDELQVLVATDVAARGLDIPNVTHVINFDQPDTYEDYVHRIGRTGRGGKSGKALTFVN